MAATGSPLSSSHPRWRRGVVFASWRADDRGSETLSGRLQPRRARGRRSNCLERDRLHVRAPHIHTRRASRDAAHKFGGNAEAFPSIPQKPSVQAYCLDCLTKLYHEPAPTVWRYLSENGILGRYAECGNCGKLRETFRSSSSL